MLMIICNIGYGDFVTRYVPVEINSGSCRNNQYLICFEILTTINNFHIGYCFDTTYSSSLNVGSYRSRAGCASLTSFIG